MSTHTTTDPKEGTMTSTTITVDIADTVGQTSAITANGGSVFTIRVTQPARVHAYDGGEQDIPGFGVVVSGGPVNGHEILYKAGSVI